jgi:hypothetical protein
VRLVFGQYLNNLQEHSAISIVEPEPQLSQSFKRQCIHRLFGLFLVPNSRLRWIGQQLFQSQPDDMSDKAEFFTTGLSRTALPLIDRRTGYTDTSGKILLTKPKSSARIADTIAYGHIVLHIASHMMHPDDRSESPDKIYQHEPRRRAYGLQASVSVMAVGYDYRLWNVSKIACEGSLIGARAAPARASSRQPRLSEDVGQMLKVSRILKGLRPFDVAY